MSNKDDLRLVLHMADGRTSEQDLNSHARSQPLRLESLRLARIPQGSCWTQGDPIGLIHVEDLLVVA